MRRRVQIARRRGARWRSCAAIKRVSFASRSIRSIDIILNSDSFLQLSTIIFDMFRSLINYGIFVFFFFFYIHIAISPMKRSIKILFHSFIHFEICICRESKRIFSNDSKQYFHSSRWWWIQLYEPSFIIESLRQSWMTISWREMSWL